MNTVIKFLLYFIIITIVLISFVYILVNSKYEYPIILQKPRSVKTLFNNTSNKIPDIGGILVHMMTIEEFQNFVKTNTFGLSQMDDCAQNYRHTCSAWTYLRKDLPPMVFSNPGKEMPTVGIIIDPQKSWELLTTMGVIDSNTSNRSCLTNESNSPFIIRGPGDSQDNCINKALKKSLGDIYQYYTVYTSDHDKGGGCPLKCDQNDDNCKYNNSGAGINSWGMFFRKKCVGDFIDCFDYTIVDKSIVPSEIIQQSQSSHGYILQSVKNNGCKIGQKPYLCVTKDSNNDNYYNDTPTQVSAYIGKNGQNWNKLFLNDTYDSGGVITDQCKFIKNDWDIWIKVLKRFYKKMLDVVNPDNSMKLDWDYELSNPTITTSYFENEVNMYINPDKKSDMYKSQNNIFLNSIVGFFYISSTCEEQLSILDGKQTTNIIGDKKYIYNNSKDRCNTYFDMNQSNRNNFERERIINSKKSVQNLVNWFNSKYNTNVIGYSVKPDSNSFPNYNSWSKSINEKVFNFSDIFSVITN